MASSELFDAAAVHANRQGQLTADQRAAYVSAVTSGRGGCLTLAIAGLILVGIVLVAGKQLAALQGAAQIIGFAVILVAIVIPALLVNRLYAIPARLRVASMHAERRDGRVEFTQGEYKAIAGGQTLLSIYSGFGNLLPGSYTFYCLHGTNWLVSVEKLEDKATASTSPITPDMLDAIKSRVPEQYQEQFAEVASEKIQEMQASHSFDINGLRAALASTFNFDQQALELNRQGKLAPQQAARLRRAGGSYLRYGLLLNILAFGIVAYALLFHANIDASGLAVVLVFFGGIGIVLIAKARSDSTDLRRGRVEMTEGTIHKYTRSTHGGSQGNYTHYYYGINQLSFEVSSYGYEALIDHVRYRVYYVPASQHLVSIEPIT